jgi:hypothetical protein
MIELTIDSIVRKALASRGLTLHYYLDFLLYAYKALNTLNMDILHRVGVEDLVIGADSTIQVPSDCVEVIGVYVLRGDKIRPLYRLDKINPDPTAGAFPVESYEDIINSRLSPVFRRTYAGRDFERGLQWFDYYREIPEDRKIRVDNRYVDSDVSVLYVAKPGKLASNSVVPSMAEDAIFEFINYSWTRFHPKNRFDYRINRSEYYNEVRKLRGRKFKFSIDDFKRVIRARAN